MKQVLHQIAELYNYKLIEAKPLSGGDINKVFLLNCTSDKLVVKINIESKFPAMFEVESKGLNLLESSKSFYIPKVIGHGVVENFSYLVLSYISSGNPSHDFWLMFTENLVTLHKKSNPTFGLDHTNYIGSLIQFNAWEENAWEFYINQRLEPQLRIARDSGYDFKAIDTFFKTITNEIPDEPASLIHGDLWNGNYVVSEQGVPVLIDPAVAYAPRELDIAMMHLFGGFPNVLYSLYNEQFPLMDGWKERIRIWQLYYLLVHLNLFGSSYLSQVKSILNHYS